MSSEFYRTHSFHLLPFLLSQTMETIENFRVKKQTIRGRYALSDNSTVRRVNFGAEKRLTVILNEVKNPLEESAGDERCVVRSEWCGVGSEE